MTFQTPCLLFDEECPLCKRFAQSLQRTKLDINLHYYSLHEEGLYEEFPFLDRDEVSKEVHLLLEKEASSVLKGSQVISFFAAQNPVVKKFSWLIESDTGQKAMNLFYKGLQQCRKSLQTSCPKCKNKKRKSMNKIQEKNEELPCHKKS